MALKACKECNKEISDKAEQCPHCGVKIKNNNIGCGTIAALLIGATIVMSAIGSFKKDADPPPTPKTAAEIKSETERAARYACRGLIKKSLHDPSTADLSEWTSALVINPSANSNIFEVYMQVRAKNAFNATRLSTMICRVERTGGDDWRLISLYQMP